MRGLLAALVAAVAVPALAAGPAAAAVHDAAGVPVPNTAWTSTAAQLDGPPSCPGPGCLPLAEPGSPDDDAPLAPDALGSPADPHEDLDAALDALATADDAATAQRARALALAVLEGEPVAGRAYSGIPLLNWNAPAKVKTVPAGGTVDVRQVRFGDHALSDTWLLRFEDPERPFAIRYRVAELGGTHGGELAPTPLLADGAQRLGGVPSTLLPLAAGGLPTGTRDVSRFTQARRLADGAAEQTRTATQVVTVRMPPARMTRAILDPAPRAGATALAVLHPATPERLAAAERAFGFAGTQPTAAERTAAIGRLAAAAPERQLWADLRALPAPGDEGFLAAARALGVQDRPLVGAMRTRTGVPPGVRTDPEADTSVVLMNAEAYVARPRLRLAAGARLALEVLNRDGLDHGVRAVALHGRRPVLGADDPGRFDWTPLDLGGGAGAAQRLDAAALPDRDGGSRTFDVALPDDAFAVWVGDPDAGDQAGTVIELDRGPRTEAIELDPSPAATPLHEALDHEGRLWVTLSGVDKVVRVTPAKELGASRRESFLLPGGAHAVDATTAPLAPGDVAVDEHGIVWVTLMLGNAVARIDPAAVRDGTSSGITVHRLDPCAEGECAEPFVPEPGVGPTREPLQMDVTGDGRGNTLLWFTEAAADRIGVARFARDGRPLGQAHLPCGCRGPAGIAIDPAGDVWFTEAITNRLGRLTPDVTHPTGAGVTLRHFDIPSAVETVEPELARGTMLTSNPHSVAIDRRGLVWFTESATGKLGVLDPARAEPGTSRGMRELVLPLTSHGAASAPADLAVDRANTVFWADEYGDAVGTVDASGAPEDWRPGRTLRPTARRSLTDQPLVDTAGDLWFLESGAGRLTRVAGVSAGVTAPGPPPELEADTHAGTLSGRGLREAGVVDVTVRRGGRLVAGHNDVPLRDGAFVVELGAGLRGGDRVEVRPQGRWPEPPLTFTVAAIDAVIGPDGVRGRALLGGEPVADAVEVLWGAWQQAPVDVADGTFAVGGADRSDRAVVRWATATPAVVARTVARATPPASGPGTDGRPPAPGPAPPGGTTPPAGMPQDAAPGVDRPTARSEQRPPACPATRWLDSTRRVALLGLTAPATQPCAGVTLELRRGRVVGLRLRDRAWRSARGGLRIGAPARAVAAALGRTAPVHGGRRAVLAHGRGEAADVRVGVRAGRVTSIRATLVRTTALDATGRRLLRGRR